MLRNQAEDQILLIGGSHSILDVRAACEREDIRLVQGRFGPGPKSVLVLDVYALNRLRECFGKLSVACAARWLIVVGPPNASAGSIRSIAEVGGVFVSSENVNLIPALLRRMLASGAPPAGAPTLASPLVPASPPDHPGVCAG